MQRGGREPVQRGGSEKQSGEGCGEGRRGVREELDVKD